MTATATDGGPITVVGATVRIVDADPKLTVTAPANGYVIGTTGSGGAKTTVIDCGAGNRTNCAATVAGGTVVTLTATADAKHLFDGWTGACAGTAACTLTLHADSAVGAAFAAARSLVVTAPSHGKATGRVGAMTVIDCGSDCSETVADGTRVALRASPDGDYEFDGWGGACASEASAECVLALDADRTVSVAFASAAIVGKCDESVVDGCASGTLNNTAFGDTDTHHHWRCDGAGGGANSRKCGKTKLGCRSGTRSWSAGGHSCEGSIASATSGQTKSARDLGDPTRGSAAYKCNDGAWLEQPGSACSVDLRCGASANVCLPNGVEWRDRRDKDAEHGACASTEAAGCAKGTYSDRKDVPLEHGACGSTRNDCAGGSYGSRADTRSEYRWYCNGIDAEDRWACLGIDGSKNWSCAYGSQSKSCGVPIRASDVNTCGVGEATRQATDASCSICKPGYISHNGACEKPPACGDAENECDAGAWAERADTLGPATNRWYCKAAGQSRSCTEPAPPPTCKANEEYALDASSELTCVCEDGHVRHNGKCEPSPDCGLTEPVCSPGTAGEVHDTLKPPKHKWTCTNAGVEEACMADPPPPDCGENETYGLDASKELTCVCVSGYHRYEGECVQNPMCSDPLVQNECKAGTATDYRDTAVYGACEAIETKGCKPDGGDFKDAPDTPKVDGTCGAKKNTCVSGETANEAETESKYTWDCLGIAGSKNWTCKGSSGEKEWDCASGDPIEKQSCELPSPGSSQSCGEAIPASDDTGCFACMPDYEPYNGDCVAQCKPNEMRDTNGKCVCKSGYGRREGVCRKEWILTVVVTPPETGRVSGTVECTSRCTATVVDGSDVSLSVAGNPGYTCAFPKMESEIGFEMLTNTTKRATCSHTLDVEAGGPYTATYVYIPFPFPATGGSSFYTTQITATATGGVVPYSFVWSGNSATTSTATYLWPTRSEVPSKVTVEVRDKLAAKGAAGASPKSKDANILLPSSEAAQDGSGDPVAFEVPLGGDLYFVWGGDGPVTAKSEDTKVVGVDVSSSIIRVNGVAAGETYVIVRAGEGEWWLPVVVR